MQPEFALKQTHLNMSLLAPNPLQLPTGGGNQLLSLTHKAFH